MQKKDIKLSTQKYMKRFEERELQLLQEIEKAKSTKEIAVNFQASRLKKLLETLQNLCTQIEQVTNQPGKENELGTLKKKD